LLWRPAWRAGVSREHCFFAEHQAGRLGDGTRSVV
jgi:hypothetical protein